jgi:hypothetical protein
MEKLRDAEHAAEVDGLMGRLLSAVHAAEFGTEAD